MITKTVKVPSAKVKTIPKDTGLLNYDDLTEKAMVSISLEPTKQVTLKSKLEQFTITPVYMTPELAQHYLNLNVKHNRTIRPKLVKLLSDTMKDGAWQLISQGITLTADGKYLIDGQHRLSAIIASGVTVPMNIIQGGTLQNFVAYDGGLARTMGDRIDKPQKIVAFANAILGIAVSSQRQYTPNEVKIVLSIFEDHLVQLISQVKGNRQGVATAPILVGAVMRMYEGHDDYVLNQYSALINKDNYLFSPMISTFSNQITASTPTGGKSTNVKLLGTNRNADIARAYKAFDPKNKNFKTLKINSMEEAISLIRAKLKIILSKNNLDFSV